MMEAIDIKRKVTALWKDTFHESDAYINLLFDHYIDPEWVEVEVDGSEIIGVLVGIPYEFGGSEGCIRGLYLCGLATKPKRRSEGVMTRLLDRVNAKAREAGFAFTFLVPRTERLVRYFAYHGYVKAFYRCQENYTSLHNFHDEYEAMLDQQKDKVADLKRRYYSTIQGQVLDENPDPETVDEIVKFLKTMEAGCSDMELLHSEQDFRNAIKLNKVLGGNVYYAKTNQNIVTAVAFTSLVDRSRIDIERLYTADQCSTYRLLEFIKHTESDAGIRVYVNPTESENRSLAEIHGMARILNLSEILKFQANWLRDLKYSILVKEHPGQIERYDIRNGNMKHRSIEVDSEEYDPTKTVISLRDMACVLFRRPDTGSLITEAFGMPSVGGYISLLPE